jgi:hypothetical protein
MNIANAMIIKTKDDFQTGQAKKVRDLLKCFEEGQDVVVVPHSLNYISITIEEEKLAVKLFHCNELECIEIDNITNFDSVNDCWEYARLVMSEAGLREEDCDADVWEEKKPQGDLIC